MKYLEKTRDTCCRSVLSLYVKQSQQSVKSWMTHGWQLWIFAFGAQTLSLPAAYNVMCVSAVVTDEVPLVMCSERWNDSLGARDSWKHAVVSSGVRCCRFVFLCLLTHFCSFLPCC